MSTPVLRIRQRGQGRSGRPRPAVAVGSVSRASQWVARMLSVILLALLALASAAGLFIADLYRDPEPVVAMFRGYDLSALLVLVPLLAVTLLPALRASTRAQLVWLGGLAYAVYHSAIYVFGSEFNDLFLIHVALFSLSVYALGFALASLDVSRVAHRFAASTPTRLVSGILLVLGVTLALFWATPSIRFALTGDLPKEGSKLIVPIGITHLGWVLDLSLLVPAYILAGVLLRRRKPWGYVLAAIVLVAGVLQQVDYMTALAFQANAAIPGATAFDLFEPVITALYLIGAAVLLMGIQRVDETASVRA
jgi:hypothetical protein